MTWPSPGVLCYNCSNLDFEGLRKQLQRIREEGLEGQDPGQGVALICGLDSEYIQ